MLREALTGVVRAPTPGTTGRPSITPPSIHGFHLDPKMVALLIGSGIIAIIVIKIWAALPKWLLVIVVPGVLIALGVAAVRLGGFQVGH